MKAELWPRVRELFERSLGADDVEALLDRECGEEPELRAAVLELRAADREGAALEPPTALGGATPTLSLPPPLPPGERVGAFTVQRALGHGGMGAVYVAEQDEPGRLVALKLLASDPADAELGAMLASEAQILARLQHPGIAAVFAAGVHDTPDGSRLPYLAMEFVADATDLVEFARRRDLDLEARLRLFAQVCDAVHAAHQKGVIHRDLKPSNVLVDDSGRVRVIDFGIASIAGRGEGVAVADARVIGTPGYISPERLVPGDDGHDLRSDVYSLGVLLRELVEVEPPRELQWIIARATAVSPDERYASAADLGADTARYRSREPVLAGPGTAGYRARCFVHRHRQGVALASAALVLLAVGLVVAVLGWQEAAQQGAAATAEARRSGALRDVLRSLIAEAAPDRQGPGVRLLDGLQHIVDDIEPSFAGQYDLQVVALTDVARLQIEIGEWRNAVALLERAVAIAERQLPDSEELAAALNLKGLAHQYLLETDAAIAAYRRAQAVVAASAGIPAELRRDIDFNLDLELGRAGSLPDPVRNLEVTYRECVADFGDGDPRTLQCGNNLAEHYRRADRLDDALRLSNHLLGHWRRAGMDSPGALVRLHNHAHLLQQFGRFDRALAIEREVIDRVQSVLPETHPQGAIALQSAGILALAAGEYAEAERHLRALLAHPAMSKATSRQQAIRPLLHAAALVACGAEHHDEARGIFAARLTTAATYEQDAGTFVWLARAAAAQAGVAGRSLQDAHDQLRGVAGSDHWATRLTANWLNDSRR